MSAAATPGPSSSSASAAASFSTSLSDLGFGSLRQIEVGPSHFAFLLADGRICRLPFSVISDRLDLSRNGSAAGGGSSAAGSGSASTSGSAGPPGLGSGSGGSGSASKSGYKTPQTASGASLSSVRAPARTRGRIIRTSTIRGRGTTAAGTAGGSSGSQAAASGSSAAASGSVIMSSSRPAPYVPEDLVAQAQSVLQGRSRTLIIRELQRTNLDVNLAVNNLLSRDEEDGDDGEEPQDSSYAPEDLISLLDAGINADHPSVIIDADAMFSDDAMFGYSQARSR